MSSKIFTMKRIVWMVLFLALIAYVWIKASDSMVRAVWYVWYGPTDRYYFKFTDPLSIDTQKDLCTKLNIALNDHLCSSQEIYAFEFYPAIEAFFYALPEEERSFGFVENRIGKYEYLHNTSMNGSQRMDYHWYDFTGDQKFPLGIEFDSDGNIQRIFTTSGRGESGGS